MKCPVTLKKVDPDVIIPNKSILEASELFLDENPWAYEFDPKEKFEDIKIWH